MPTIPKVSPSAVVNVALDTINLKKQALVFVNSKQSAERMAEDISKKNTVTTAESHALADKVKNVLSRPTKQCERLSECIKKGIAFHHAGLAYEQRVLIEDGFREGTIKIISCTPTLAAGVDLPAYRTIIRDLKRYTGRGLVYIPVLEYLQMAGRSGRPTYDKVGEAIIISQSSGHKEAAVEKYINGEPEDIYSKLAVEPVLRTYLLSLISAGFISTVEEMSTFFGKTFYAFQYQDIEGLQYKLMETLKLLEKWEFVVLSKGSGDFVSAADIASEKIRPTRLGKRVSQLYLDPLTAHQLMERLKRIPQETASLPTFPLLHALCYTLEMRPLLRIKTAELDMIDEIMSLYSDELLEKEPSLYDYELEEFQQSLKTAKFLQDWLEEKDERILLDTYAIRPGEIKVKLDSADWLIYSCQEMVKLMNLPGVSKVLQTLRTRLKYGVKEELLPLLKVKRIGRVRARKLFKNRVASIADLKRMDLSTLAHIVGKGIALHIKHELGQEEGLVPIKENKRKGQINLNDFT